MHKRVAQVLGTNHHVTGWHTTILTGTVLRNRRCQRWENMFGDCGQEGQRIPCGERCNAGHDARFHVNGCGRDGWLVATDKRTALFRMGPTLPDRSLGSRGSTARCR
jgi:hypothetical protein